MKPASRGHPAFPAFIGHDLPGSCTGDVGSGEHPGNCHGSWVLGIMILIPVLDLIPESIAGVVVL